MSRIHDALKKAEEQKYSEVNTLSETRVEDVLGSGFSNGALEMVAEQFGAAVPVPPAPLPISTSGSSGPEVLLQNCVRTVWNPTSDALFIGATDQHSLGMEEFRTLRARLFQIRTKRHLKTLLVSSALPGEGKSFVSANLAQVFARQRGGRTLLIDADLRKPHLHELFGAPSEPGLFEYLSGKANEFDVIQKSTFEDLYFMPAGDVGTNASELIGNGKMAALLEIMAPLFNWIVIDSSPVIPVSDPTRLATLCDGVLLVVQSGSTSHVMAERAKKEFQDSLLLGVVFNRVPKKENPYYKYSYEKYGKAGAVTP